MKKKIVSVIMAAVLIFAGTVRLTKNSPAYAADGKGGKR